MLRTIAFSLKQELLGTGHKSDLTWCSLLSVISNLKLKVCNILSLETWMQQALIPQLAGPLQGMIAVVDGKPLNPDLICEFK